MTQMSSFHYVIPELRDEQKTKAEVTPATRPLQTLKVHQTVDFQ